MEEEIKQLRFQHTTEAGSSMVASTMKEVADQAPFIRRHISERVFQ
ncbi:hypothetical protein [Bacillus glycinifermentans]|nr:hypothetical protein [Bacillus glycinifermentans]UOY86775.1 hypothetical protein MW696_11675 [Bacillus glycinifermentans]